MTTTNGQMFPPEWPDRIRALASGELTPVAPRRAASVLLLRNAPEGLAVHMLRRRASMAFAGGAYAYPGGSVDPRNGPVLDDEFPHIPGSAPASLLTSKEDNGVAIASILRLLVIFIGIWGRDWL